MGAQQEGTLTDVGKLTDEIFQLRAALKERDDMMAAIILSCGSEVKVTGRSLVLVGRGDWYVCRYSDPTSDAITLKVMHQEHGWSAGKKRKGPGTAKQMADAIEEAMKE